MTNFQAIRLIIVTIVDFILFVQCLAKPSNSELEGYIHIWIWELQIFLIYIGAFRVKDCLQLLRKATPKAVVDWLHRRQDSV